MAIFYTERLPFPSGDTMVLKEIGNVLVDFRFGRARKKKQDIPVLATKRNIALNRLPYEIETAFK